MSATSRNRRQGRREKTVEPRPRWRPGHGFEQAELRLRPQGSGSWNPQSTTTQANLHPLRVTAPGEMPILLVRKASGSVLVKYRVRSGPWSWTVSSQGPAIVGVGSDQEKIENHREKADALLHHISLVGPFAGWLRPRHVGSFSAAGITRSRKRYCRDAAGKLADDTLGRTALHLGSPRGGHFMRLWKSVRERGFRLEAPAARASFVGLHPRAIKAEPGVWYLNVKASDGFSFSRVYALPRTSPTAAWCRHLLRRGASDSGIPGGQGPPQSSPASSEIPCPTKPNEFTPPGAAGLSVARDEQEAAHPGPSCRFICGGPDLFGPLLERRKRDDARLRRCGRRQGVAACGRRPDWRRRRPRKKAGDLSPKSDCRRRPEGTRPAEAWRREQEHASPLHT